MLEILFACLGKLENSTLYMSTCHRFLFLLNQLFLLSPFLILLTTLNPFLSPYLIIINYNEYLMQYKGKQAFLYKT